MKLFATRRIVHATTLALLLIAAGASDAAAQEQGESSGAPLRERTFRGALGLGPASGGLAIGLDVAMYRPERLYRARLVAQADGGMFPEPGPSEGSESVSELALMIGRGRRVAGGYGSLSAGLAMVTVDREPAPFTDETAETSTTVGFPVQAELSWGGPVGIGTSIVADLNAKRSFVAFMVSLQVGRVP